MALLLMVLESKISYDIGAPSPLADQVVSRRAVQDISPNAVLAYQLQNFIPHVDASIAESCKGSQGNVLAEAETRVLSPNDPKQVDSRAETPFANGPIGESNPSNFGLD